MPDLPSRYLAGGARQRVTFFARAKDVNKESTPPFVALRVANFPAAVRGVAANPGGRSLSPVPGAPGPLPYACH